MTRRRLRSFVCLAALFGAVCAWPQSQKKAPESPPVGYSDTPQLPNQKWRVHDIQRPHPRVVTPAPPDRPWLPPSDAIVLFDGKDLSQWVQHGKNSEAGKVFDPPRWKVENGYVEVTGGTGDIVTKEKFGDAQYHIEWAAPATVRSSSQLRGNSGFILMQRYEIQILDSWQNVTYADGQAGSMYGQWPPFVNASRRPGEWQSYDVVFEAPKFEGSRVVKPAAVTVFHNGIVLHHRQEFIGQMAHRIIKPYEPHGAEDSLMLQDHGDPVRFRNIWVRRLRGYDQP